MLGDIGRIPIISLSGCKSLSDILSELPLPQPLPKTVSGPELIDDPRVYQEAQNLLQSHNDFLVESLSSTLASTSTDGIVLKNDQPNAPIDFHTLPPVLKDAITKMPNILEENRSFKCIYSSKEVLQILNKEVGKSSAKLTSPTKSISSSNARHQPATTGPTVAPVKLTLKQPQPPGEVSGSGTEGIYSVTAVEPLKLSIKRASILPHTQETSKRSKMKRRSKNSSSTSGASNPLSNSVISGNQNIWPINPAESLKPQSVPGAQVPIPIHTSPCSIVQQSSRHHQLLPTAVVAPVPPGLPNPSPSVQLVIPPPPPTTSSTSRKSGQLLSNVFNQLLHSSEQDSTIASLLSSSDGQSTGTPTSMDPSFHPRSPPLSVPSNCSYPATPGMNSSSLSVNNPNVGSVGPVPDPSPINAIFDTTAGTNADLSDGRGDSNPQPAVPPQPPPPPPPRGLAAYLQKSRYHHAEVVASPEEGDAYARQHGSVPPMSSSASSPWTERRSGVHAGTASNVGAGIYPTSSSSLTSTPNGQEAGSKEKRGRRRKSELEGLINWQVRDQTTPLKKQHGFHSHQILPILENNSPQHPSASHHSSRGNGIPSDNEGISGFTEPLGERVKRRRQQHKTPPLSVSGGADTIVMNKAPMGKSGSGSKNSGSKRAREDTLSEVSLSPKRERRGRPPRHRQILSSEESEEEDRKIGGGGDGRQDQDDNASVSSCLTDSPVPRKHSLQRLVEEFKGRPPSLPRIDNLRSTPMSSTPVPTNEHVTSHSPSRERLKKISSVRSSASPPPLLPLQHDSSSADTKERHRRLKKRRQIHQPPFSSDEEDEIRGTPRKSSHCSMLVADQLPPSKHNSGHSRITEVSSPSSQMHRKRRKTVAINLSSSSTISSTSQSSSSSSEDFKSASFDKQQHQRQRRRRNTSHSSQEEKPPIQRMKRELTPSTDPCTDSSEYEACEADGFASSFKYDEPLSDLSDSDRAEMIVEAEKRIAEEVAKFAATATGFSNHISEFLLRVGGLDLLKYAGEMSMTTVDPVGGRGDSATMVDQTPVEARLSRREVNALYNEAEEVRVAGSISDEPSGRLVRFLNLLRVHIRDASSLMAPNPTTADFKDLIQRRKARLERRSAGGSGNSDNTVGNRELVSEALLWSHPVWMRVLRGLDSALIALHIIAGPDVPRGRLLAMEELVESITTITQFHFNQLTSAIHTPPSDSKRSSSNIASDLTNIARESLGTRLSESLTGLASLVRLHPTRFTDSLIIHLTELAILVISCGLSSGTYRRSPPPGSSINAAIASVIYPEPAPTPISGEPEERWERRQAVYRERNTWRLQLQRSALALVSTIFLQYDKHRHMVAADILNSLIFSPLKAASNTSSNKAAASTFTKKRNFWVLASGSFLNDWTPFCQGSQSTTTSNMVANGHFLRVHPFTAVLMALIQGLIPAPSYVCGGSGRRSSSACAPATPSSGVSQQSTTTGTGMSEQYGIPDTNQLVKEEKAISTGYTNAILTSQYFVTDIFRKVNAKGEENFRPLIETVITDLLRVAADAPVEWPVASLILSVFGQSFMQHVNSPSSTNTNSSRGPGAQGNSTSSSRSADPNTRAIALECLITLASGMYQLEKIRNLARKTGGGDIIEVRSALSAFLSSPVLGLYNLTLTTDDAPNIITPVDHVKQREFAFKLISRLRYTYFDGLSLAAKRFHLVTWLHEINQELTSTNPGPSDERRKQLEEIRKNLLIEFASTHHSISGIAPWLPPPRGAGILSTNGGAMSVSGGGGGGSGGTRAGLISPAASEPSVAWASGPLSDTKLALYTGYGMGADSRRKKIARAHRLATKIVAKYSHMPIGFDVLYMQIVKMVHDPSLAIRTRAIRGLSTLVEICPECIPVPAVKEENPGNLNASDLISIIPLRLMDNSPMVREAAVELVARLVKIPTSRNSSVFLARLFKHLINRVLDLQISVRKRAIKSLQNLLLLNQHSDHTEESRCTSQTPLLSSKQKFEACVTLLRRSNDEESIKKIVLETFTSLWFTPLSTSDPSKLAARLEKHARNLCEIVLHVRNRVAGVVEDFMKSILNQEGPEKAAQVDAAASQIVEFLVKMIQRCHNANWHSVNCQFHPKHHRENASSSKPNCECSSQPPDGLSPSNTFLLLSMIAKPRPQLLLQHIPFIVKVVTSIMPPNNGSVPDGNALSYAIEIIEPCCFHVASKGGIYLSQLFPNGTVLLEDCLIYLLQRHCRVVVDASLSCLATIVNHLTKDYTRVAVCFANFYECLIQEKKRKLPIIKPTSSSMSSSNSLSVRCHWRARPKVLRAVYTVGLICKLFSLQDLANAAFELVSLPKGDSRLPPDIDISILTHQATNGKNNRDEVFSTLMFFAETALLLNMDEETRRAINAAGGYDVEMAKKAIAGLSFLANRHDYLFRSSRLQEFFKSILSGVNVAFPKDVVADLQCIVLDCINNFLVDEEKTAVANDSNWLSQSKQESLKVLGDMRDIHGSTVVQIYLQTALEHCVTSASTTVRTKALTLISTAMRQGLMMPFPFIAALICLQTDVENTIKSRAVILLQEIAQQHSGFLALKAAPGIRSAFQLQKIIASSTSPSNNSDGKQETLIRGAYANKPPTGSEKSDTIPVRPTALNHPTYSLLQSNKQHRRSLISNLVNLFDNDCNSQSSSSYASDNGPSSKKSSAAVNSANSDSPSGDNGLQELIFICDQLAHFPYKTLDEIYYLARILDIRVSTIGSAIARSLQDCLLSSAHLKTESVHLGDADNATDLPPVYDRKIANLLEDVESELFIRSSMPSDVGAIENKVIDRINRPVAAEKRQLFREKVVRQAPPCLLLMSLRKYLEEAYDVTSNKLGSYSFSSEDKHYQRFIPAPSARTLNSGVLYHLIYIPPLVAQCALDPAWPRVTSSRVTSSSISDSTILRLALQVHRQLLTVDGADDELDNSTSSNMPLNTDQSVAAQSGSSRSTVASGGDGPQQKKALVATPTNKDGEKSRVKSSHNEHYRSQAKISSKAGHISSKQQSRRSAFESNDDKADDLSDSLSSLSDGSSQFGGKYERKKKRHSPSAKSSKHKSTVEGTGSIPCKHSNTQSHTNTSTSIPKKDTSAAALPLSSSSKKKSRSTSNPTVQHDPELSSLSSLEGDNPGGATSQQPVKSSHHHYHAHKRRSSTQSSSSISASHQPPNKKPSTTGTSTPSRPKYDLAPLPGTPDIRTQHEQRRKAKALAAKKAVERHQLMEKSKHLQESSRALSSPHNIASQQPKNELRRSCRPRLGADDSEDSSDSSLTMESSAASEKSYSSDSSCSD